MFKKNAVFENDEDQMDGKNYLINNMNTIQEIKNEIGFLKTKHFKKILKE